jgi:prepilin-type N-terminal cleavage/methylation domain-containing protein
MKQGFTLLELSVVLVIIGLLAGGIMLGQDLVKQAELRDAMSDYERFLTARQAFEEKYNARAGDMRNATQYWGRQMNAAHCITNTGAAVNTNTGVCDGNGDGLVWPAAGAANQSGEVFQFWRHLQMANMVEGTYTGLSGSVNGADYAFGENSPVSSVEGAGWGASYVNNADGSNTLVFVGNHLNAFVFGGDDIPILTMKP